MFVKSPEKIYLGSGGYVVACQWAHAIYKMEYSASLITPFVSLKCGALDSGVCCRKGRLNFISLPFLAFFWR
jgi:hypothetical protein